MRTGGAELLPGLAGLWAAWSFTWSSPGLFRGSHHTLHHVASPPEPSSSLSRYPWLFCFLPSPSSDHP